MATHNVPELEALLLGGAHDDVIARLRELLRTSLADDERLALAELAELAGVPELALELLGELDSDGADAMRGRLQALVGPAPVEPSSDRRGPRPRPAPWESDDAEPLDPEEPEPWLQRLLDPAPADLARFLNVFAGREDTHARQWAEKFQRGGYSPIRGPITADLVRAHLAGSITLGVYPIRHDGTVTFCAFDLDIRRAAREKALDDRAARDALWQAVRSATLRLADGLRKLDLPVLIEHSGNKGYHVWVLFAEPVLARAAWSFGNLAARRLMELPRDITVEVFPRQPNVGEGGLGNLIKLPLGVHRVTGRRGLFVGTELEPLPDQLEALSNHERAMPGRLADAHARLRELPEPEPPPPGAALAPGDGAAPVTAAPVARARPKPPFEERSLHESPVLSSLIGGCGVVRRLVEQALGARFLTHDERVVLAQAMGGLPDGVDAVNFLFDRCPDGPHHDRLTRRLRGHPISCARVRARVPGASSQVPCNCAFPSDGDRYPSPVLHVAAPLRDAPGAAPADAPHDEPARAAPPEPAATAQPETPSVPAAATAMALAPADQVTAPLGLRAVPESESAAQAHLPAEEAVAEAPQAELLVPEPPGDSTSHPLVDDQNALLAALREAVDRLPGRRLAVAEGVWTLRGEPPRRFLVFTPWSAA